MFRCLSRAREVRLNRCHHRELLAFFLLAFGFTWACWIGSIFVAHAAGRYWMMLAGQFGPLLAAVLVTVLSSGPGGVRWFLASLVNWRFNAALALLAVLLPPAAYYAAIALKSWVTGEPAPPYSYRICLRRANQLLPRAAVGRAAG